VSSFIEPFLQLLVVIALSVLPGWRLAGLLKVDALMRMTMAAAISYTLMYLLEIAAYLLSAPQWVPVALCLVLSAVSLAEIIRSHRKRQDGAVFPWAGLAAWAALGLWILAFQFLIVVYGAVFWFGDWLEHYERSQFFLKQLPATTTFLMDLWTLPARGPLFNAAAGLLMGILGDGFHVYQIVATVLNTFPVLPMALLLRDFGKLRERTALVIAVILFGLAPFAVQSETYTWTKFLTLGFILCGIHLHLYGLSRDRLYLACLSIPVFAAGLLVHYLTLLFAAFFVPHLLFSALARRWSWRPVLCGLLGAAVLAASWFGFTFATFGIRGTLEANSTLGTRYVERSVAQGSAPLPWRTAFAGNLVTTALPYSWRHGLVGPGHAPRVAQVSLRRGGATAPPAERDRFKEWLFDVATNPCSIPGSMGWAGALCFLICLVRTVRGRQDSRLPDAGGPDAGPPLPLPGRRFWLAFCVIGIPLNILPARVYDMQGVAHHNLQPFVCLAAVWFVHELGSSSTVMKVILTVVFAAESLLGSAALVFLQMREVPVKLSPDGRPMATESVFINMRYVENYVLKLRAGAVFLSDRLGSSMVPACIAGGTAIVLLLLLSTIPDRIHCSGGGERSA